jgi:hypothetical protein
MAVQNYLPEGLCRIAIAGMATTVRPAGAPAVLLQFFLKQLVRQLSFIPLKLIVKSPTHGQPMLYRQEYALEGAA